MKKLAISLVLASSISLALLPGASVGADPAPGNTGYVSGGGLIDTGKDKKAAKITFGGNVVLGSDESVSGQWQVNFHNVNNDSMDKGRFHSTSFSQLVFNTNNRAKFIATGRFNGEDGWRVDLRLRDGGDPDMGNDYIRIILYSPQSGDVAVYDTWDQVGWWGGGDSQYGWQGDFPDEDPMPWDVRTQLDGGNLEVHPPVVP